MVYNFIGLLNRKYKKINGKVRFVGLSTIPKNREIYKSSILISTSYGLLSASEIESGRRAIRKMLGKNKKIKLMVRVYPYIPLTGKPSEVRMGRGKGSRIRKWVSFVKPGKVVFELKNISIKKGNLILKKAGEKLSIKNRTLFVFKMKSIKFRV